MNDYAQQLTDIYNQLSAVNGILANLATLSSVNTIQGTLQAQMDTIYSTIGTLSQQLQAMDLTVTALLVDLRSS